MTDTDKLIAGFVQRVINGLDETTSFLNAQIPDYIQQLLLWYGVKSFITSLVGVILLVSWSIILWKFSGRGDPIENSYRYKWTLTHDDDGDISPISMITGFITFTIVMTGISIINLDWLQIWIAPKVWLVEYAQSLVK